MQVQIGKAALNIIAAVDDDFAIKYGTVSNIKNFFEEGTNVGTSLHGGNFGTAADSSVKVAAAGVLIYTGLYHVGVFKPVLVITKIAQNVFVLAFQARSVKDISTELAKLGINSLELTCVFYASPMLFTAKVTAQVGYRVFQSVDKFIGGNYIESAESLIIGSITAYRGYSDFKTKFSVKSIPEPKPVVEESKQTESKPVVEEPVDEIIPPAPIVLPNPPAPVVEKPKSMEDFQKAVQGVKDAAKSLKNMSKQVHKLHNKAL